MLCIRTRRATILIGFDKTAIGIRVAISLNDAVNIRARVFALAAVQKKKQRGFTIGFIEKGMRARVYAVRERALTDGDWPRNTLSRYAFLADPLTWHAQPIRIDVLAFIIAFLPTKRPPNYLPFVQLAIQTIVRFYESRHFFFLSSNTFHRRLLFKRYVRSIDFQAVCAIGILETSNTWLYISSML